MGFRKETVRDRRRISRLRYLEDLSELISIYYPWNYQKTMKTNGFLVISGQ